MPDTDKGPRTKTSVYSPTIMSNYDFPQQAPGTVPAHKLLFATLPRCGSHFICQHLFETGYAGLPLEYFNPAHWDRWRVRIAAESVGASPAKASMLGHDSTLANAENPRASAAFTLSALLRRRTGPNGCFSAKLHYAHLKHLSSFVSESWLQDAHWVRIERLDTLAQVVSLDIAMQTGSWIYTQQVWRTPTYDFKTLRRRLIRLLRDRHEWSRFFNAHGIRPHTLCYENFSADPAASVNDVVDRFGLRAPDTIRDVPLPNIPRIQSQSSTINAEWVERLADDLNGDLAVLSTAAGEMTP